MLVAYCHLCRHSRNLAEGGCLLSRFHFTRSRSFLGHVACRTLPWQGLISLTGIRLEDGLQVLKKNNNNKEHKIIIDVQFVNHLPMTKLRQKNNGESNNVHCCTIYIYSNGKCWIFQKKYINESWVRPSGHKHLFHAQGYYWVCFGSCQLTLIRMSIIKLNTGYALPHQLRKFGISHWFACGADGPADKWSRNHQNFSDGQISKFHRYAWGPAGMRDSHTWSSSIGRKLKGALKNLKNNANMNEWMNGKAYQNMHWKLLEKPDISRVLPLLNHWGRGSTLEMSSFFQPFQCIQCILMNFAIHNYNILQ